MDQARPQMAVRTDRRCGHFLLVERPTDINKRIVDFLAT
jgi:pimeloyl-ACP methyl ester carboxylesterase